jgi:hypothetical protein
MNFVKNLVFAGLLVFTLSFNTLAGDQHTPGALPPPPPDKLIEEQLPPIVDPYVEITVETTDYLFFEALAALLSVY